ncbi:hypothetical protein Trihar35433_8735 [Trichoderma harzianum]|nr:hypothetical protein Trihar35433_8735 [Trichoderma harzianum]
MPPPARQEFQIGWICALPIEVAAAKEMLDENFGILDEQDSNDTNSYTLGRIGKHYVAIAGLGQYGTTSATTVAINMMRTFSESLRIGLMVGIAAGIPSLRHDIRLGDIIVSYPDGTCGGVIQYDMGKMVKGKLIQTGSLKSPPRSLLTALTNLQATALTDDPKYPIYIDKAISRNERTRKTFARPNTSTDRLFKIHHEHPEIARTCEECSKDWEEDRNPREEIDPQVHYGIIASGNMVIKHGQTRERLRQETEALCFEMEAAGLMMDFPCIVVRGICDYADSHKNNAWQGYAALAAASYAKELLSYVPTGIVSQERLVIEMYHQMSDATEELQRGFQQREAHHREKTEKFKEKEKRECHQTFKTSTYEQYKNINPNRAEGTCRWVLENSHYHHWRESNHNDLLWISADPGCGKSVLAKSLIDGDLDTSGSISICYFFFKDSDDQSSFTAALCAILHQLFGMQSDLLRHALPEWRKTGRDIQQEADCLWRIFEAAFSDDAFSRTICVIDALDECRPSDQAKLIKLLANFYTQSQSLTRPNWMKFLVTSRPYLEIQEGFYSATKLFPRIHIRGEEENEQIHDEINLIVKLRVEELGQIEGLETPTLQRIEKQLLQMEHRTYLWLQLAMDDIRIMLRDSLRPDDETIQLIPSSIDSAYEKILSRAPPARRVEVKMILQIIVGARRPLKIEEMAVALGVGLEVGSSADLRLAATSGLKAEGFAEKIRHLCGLFVFIDKGANIDIPDWNRCTPLWIAAMLEDSDMTKLLITMGADINAVGGTGYTALLEAVLSQRVSMVKLLIELGADIEIKEKRSGASVLWLAAERGWVAMMKLLIQLGADINAKDSKWGLTPLSRAVQLRDRNMVKLLVELGADIEARDGKSGLPPLSRAAFRSEKSMVELLIELQADIESKDGSEKFGMPPLWWAVWGGDEGIVRFLVDMGADIKSKDKQGSTILSWASGLRERGKVVKLLVELGCTDGQG